MINPMNRDVLGATAVVLAILAFGHPTVAAEGELAALNPARVHEIAAMLPERPTGFGKPAADRAAWDDLRTRRVFGDVIGEAEKLLREDFPKWDDELYLDF